MASILCFSYNGLNLRGSIYHVTITERKSLCSRRYPAIIIYVATLGNIYYIIWRQIYIWVWMTSEELCAYIAYTARLNLMNVFSVEWYAQIIKKEKR